MIGLIFFIGGLAGGSFLAATVSRLEVEIEKKKICWKKVFGLGKWRRSGCDSCGRKLVWWENIPVVSFLFLAGQCRTCHSPIPLWYPAVELATGGVFFLTFLFWQQGFANLFLLAIFLAIAVLLVFVFVFDFRCQIILDETVIALIIFTGLMHLITFSSWSRLIGCFAAGLGGAGFLFLLHLLTKGKGMGLGDVKFAFFMGFFLGWQALLFAFWLAFLTGGMLAVIMLIAKKASLGQRIALGPFLVLGTVIAWWWGEKIIFIISQWLI